MKRTELSVANIKELATAAAMKAATAALEEIGEKAVTDARSLAPVRKAFKNPSKSRKRYREFTGKYAYLDVGQTGRGSTMLKRRQKLSILNQMHRGGRDLDLGSVTHKGNRKSGEITSFKSTTATTFESTGKARPSRSGRGTEREVVVGFKLKSSYRQQKLTARARYALAHGEGVHEVGGESSSRRGAGHLVFGGALRDSIRGRIEPGDKSVRLQLIADIRYAKYVEYGTYKDYAQPFMRPAIKNAEKSMRPIISKHLQGLGLRIVR